MKVPGFRAAAVAAGMRYQGRPDLGLIVSDEPAAAAGVFTRSKVKAAPVLWSREKLFAVSALDDAPKKRWAIVVNSGQANACTGEAGAAAAEASARAIADAVGLPKDQVLLASTGVIGEVVNVEALSRSVPELTAGLSPDGLPFVARAMMTTDTRPKIIQAEGEIDGKPFRVVGLAKGSGMIAPNMATMLSFILTDADVTSGFLQGVLKRGAAKTFNNVTVDGDTSTNDSLFALASGLAGNTPLADTDSLGADIFEDVMVGVMAELAKMLAADGEGATKLVRIVVSGAVDEFQAKDAAMTVANSPLVKTALFGEDPNWGRIMGALGRSRADFDPGEVTITVQDQLMVKNGLGAGNEDGVAAAMRAGEIPIFIDLGAGSATAEVYTCDLSVEYIRINADYRS